MALEGATDPSIWLVIGTLVMLEAALSFDNAAILAAISRRLPPESRPRAINLGLTLAYILRVGAILLISVLLANRFLIAIGGGYLMYLCISHFLALATRGGSNSSGSEKLLLQRLGMSAFAAAIVTIGTVDLAFAVDQVVAAFAFTEQIWVIVLAATIGILSLRILAPYLTRLMNWLPPLEHMAYIAVGFIGFILVGEWMHDSGHIESFSVSKGAKLATTLALFVIPVAWRLTLGRKVSLHGDANG